MYKLNVMEEKNEKKFDIVRIRLVLKYVVCLVMEGECIVFWLLLRCFELVGF